MKNLIIICAILFCLGSFVEAQTLTDVLLPRFIEGIQPTNTNRIPCAYWAKIVGLTPSATYRYFNMVVISTDAATANGAGNVIFASKTGNFTRTSSVGMVTAGQYGEFTTDATGSYEGWFVTEPTGNATRFVPGRFLYARIMLNDGAGGTTVATRLTTTDSMRVVKLDVTATDSTGTGLYGLSSAAPKDFVLLYDNVAGSGRPISASFIESDGTDNTTTNNYSAFYANNVNGVDGAYGVVLPNLLPNGIRRVERRSLITGQIVSFATDADGIWPSGANTINPTGGTTAIVLTNSDAPLLTRVKDISGPPQSYYLDQNYPNPFNPTTKIEYQLPFESKVTLRIYNLLGQVVATLVNGVESVGYKSVDWNARGLVSGAYFYQLEATNLSDPTKSFTQVRKVLLLK